MLGQRKLPPYVISDDETRGEHPRLHRPVLGPLLVHPFINDLDHTSDLLPAHIGQLSGELVDVGVHSYTLCASTHCPVSVFQPLELRRAVLP